MTVDFVYEDGDGAYIGATPRFEGRFNCLESNPNFDVFENGKVRLMVGRCSRIADDNDYSQGRYGIDFHRAEPVFIGESGLSFQRAGQTVHVNSYNYAKELPQALKNTCYTRAIAFAASDEAEHRAKLDIYRRFYSYVFSDDCRAVYETPHSGAVTREADEALPQPKLECDAWTAGIASLCAYQDDDKEAKRKIVSIHSNGYFGSILDIGDFGILETARLHQAAKKLKEKYDRDIRSLDERYRRDIFQRIMRRLEDIQTSRGTLDPKQLVFLSPEDKSSVNRIIRGLKRYGREVKHFTLEEFEAALQHFSQVYVVDSITVNRFFSGRKTSKLLGLRKRMAEGVLDWAIQIEFSKFYLQHVPQLMADIVVDIKRECSSTA